MVEELVRKKELVHELVHRWYVVGKLGAVQLMAIDVSHLPEVHHVFYDGWQGVDLGYHSIAPTHASEGHEVAMENCDILPTGKCHYTGSSVPAMLICKYWREHGADEEIIWGKLDNLYFTFFYQGK